MGGGVMDATFWMKYRKTTGDLTWRLATPEDQAAIDRIKEASARLLNEEQKSPALFSRPVLLALVAENPAGEVVEALYLEAQAEVVKIGCSPTTLLETAGIESDLYAWLRGIGFKTATIRTRKSLKEKMAPVLEFLGFSCEDDEFSRWTRHL
jgi:hypothetical protein